MCAFRSLSLQLGEPNEACSCSRSIDALQPSELTYPTGSSGAGCAARRRVIHSVATCERERGMLISITRRRRMVAAAERSQSANARCRSTAQRRGWCHSVSACPFISAHSSWIKKRYLKSSLLKPQHPSEQKRLRKVYGFQELCNVC